jgi:ADP-heptose:LPS heptosyltransferase
MSRPTVLVLRALGLGDLLTIVPALRAIARAFPTHERVLATTAELAPLALHTRAVERVIAAHPLAPVAWSGPPPDVAVNLHGRGPQSHAVLRALSPRRTIAFAHPEAPETAGAPQWRHDEHEVKRWCRLLAESGIPASPDALDIDTPLGEPPPAARGAALLHPGAASAARRWPVSRWVEVARALRRAGRDVVITGGPGEIALAKDVAHGAGIGDRAVLAGRTTVMDLARAVAASSLVVCGDTGIAHLATALRRPSVVLFGPTPPAWWGPPEDRPWHRALWAGHIGAPDAPVPDLGLLRLQVSDVLAALAKLDAMPLHARAAHVEVPR